MEKTRKERTKRKQAFKLNLNVSLIALSVNSVNALIEQQTFSEKMKT